MRTLKEAENRKIVKTPRGSFRLVEGEEVRKLKEEGYGYHHDHGLYVVVCTLNQGVAISKEDYNRYFRDLL